MNRLQRIILALLLIPVFGHTQVWNKIYGTTHRLAPATVLAPDGALAWDYRFGSLVSYMTSDTFSGHYLVRLNARGDTVWTRQNIFGSGYSEQAMLSAAQLTNGDYVVTAECNSAGIAQVNLMLARLDSSGNILMRRVVYAHGTTLCQGQVLNTASGGYYLITNNRFYASISTGGYGDSLVSVFKVEKFNSADTRIAVDSARVGDVNNFYSGGCIFQSATGRNGHESFAYSLKDTKPAADGGLFCAFSLDTSSIFSIPACGIVNHPGAVAADLCESIMPRSGRCGRRICRTRWG